LLVGLKEIHPNLSHCPVTGIDGDGCFDKSFEAVRKRLRLTNARRIIVGAINDTSALGALRAFQEAGRTDRCVIMSHNASPEGRAELREPNTRLIGSVGYFPERYGDDLIRVSLDLLNRRPVPPAVFVKHQIIAPDNVDHFYPNDALLQTALAGSSGALAWSV
jgi:ribose transport system substrate-binding protein